MRVLLAEDDVDSADTYKEILENRGHQVVVTYNGVDCITEYLSSYDGKANSGYDAVIIDYSMPVLNGTQVAKKILDINPKQQITFISGYGSELLANMHGLDSIDFLPKPIDPKTLIKLVERSPTIPT